MQQLNLNFFYKLFFDDQFYELICLRDSIILFYKKIYENTDLLKKNIKLIILFENVEIINFTLKYDGHLIIFNQTNKIIVRDLFPETIIYDYYLSNKIKTVKPRNKNIIDRNKFIQNNTTTDKNQFRDKTINNCSFGKVPLKNQHKVIDQNANNDFFINNKMRIFDSDKKSYIKIKDDINKGILLKENMNPFFMPKYSVFKLLENRNMIDFGSNDNITEEYELFNDLYEVYEDKNDQDDKNDDNKNNQAKSIYIPHNFHYWSEDKKEEYAQKYNLSLAEFENNYVNKSNPTENILDKINEMNETDGIDHTNEINEVNEINETEDQIESINSPHFNEFLKFKNDYENIF